MRRIVITLAIILALIVGMSIVWIFGGRQISLLLDRLWTVETASMPVGSVTYEGNGNGGVIQFGTYRVNLAPADPHAEAPHVGSTKNDQLAMASGGKVFAFGPMHSSENDRLISDVQSSDTVSFAVQHSVLPWPVFELNFMTGKSPSLKRHVYYRLSWKKASGAKLEMLWRFEQYFYSDNGWANGFMTHEDSTGLIGVDISAAGR
jgi:hypothetical protein